MQATAEPLALRLAGKDLFKQSDEVAEWEVVVVRVEAVLVIVLTEVNTTVVVRRVDECFSCITVTTEVVRVVVPLEQAVMLDNPGRFAVEIGPNDCRRQLTVVLRGKHVSDVVKQGRHDHIYSFIVAECSGWWSRLTLWAPWCSWPAELRTM